MLEFLYGSYAEGASFAQTSSSAANLDLGARVVMVTSAVGGEGKTTVASDLAPVLARSGRSVALCDLDLRSPTVHDRLGLSDRRGLVDVAFGLEPLASALVPIRWAIPSRASRPHSGAAVAADSIAGPAGHDEDARASRGGAQRGHLDVLALGRGRPPSPADFVGSTTVRQIIDELAASHEIVILDTPPPLPVSDSLTISEYADAALVVCGSRRAAGRCW